MLTTNVKRRDFCLVYDVTNGNPNGNPDDGGAPRTDLDEYGEVTAECIKRKIRTAIAIMTGRDDGSSDDGYKMYVERGSVLNRAIRETYEQAGIEIKPTGSTSPKKANGNGKTNGNGHAKANGNGKAKAKASSEDGSELSSDAASSEAATAASGDEASEHKLEEKDMRVSADEAKKGNVLLCKRFFDVRWFGAVVVGVGSGRLTGPLQLTMGKTVRPVELRQIGNTRCATTNEKQAEEQQGRNQNMSRRTIISHGVYLQQGFLNAFQAKNTGFTEADWDMFLEALKAMFEIDRASGRGFMTLRQVVIFEHDNPLGNARAADLFKLLQVKPSNPEESATSFEDYVTTIDRSKLPAGVTLKLLYPEDEVATEAVAETGEPKTETAAPHNGKAKKDASANA